MDGRPLTPMATYLVHHGAVGWHHPHWLGRFYPEDLPEDWMLTFYNTQFRAVFVPHAQWSAMGVEGFEQWLRDTHAGFRFVLEAGPAPAGEAARILGERLGLVASAEDPRLLWFDATTDLKALALEIGTRTKPLYLFSRDADLERLEQVHNLLELMGL